MKLVYDLTMLGGIGVVLWAVTDGFSVPLLLLGAVMIGIGFAAGCHK